MKNTNNKWVIINVKDIIFTYSNERNNNSNYNNSNNNNNNNNKIITIIIISRLASINDIIYRACCRADIPAIKEPTGLTRTDGKRPYGSTLVPWSAGKCVSWDVTIADTMAPSYAAISSVSAGLVAEQSSARKLAKYSELAINHIFVPIAMESFGPICAEALTFLSELGRRMSVVTGDMRETTFLFQRLSIAIQRFNCILFKSSFIDGENVPESFLFE